ncbi:MAG: hypothetical protein KAR54_02385 [Candidatus Pacebacteria bacterium]|nr:hypothetical protein [Candidatus Paceibacterota bacterium]
MKIPQITIHGRFQPPLHISHKNYIMDAFNLADKVTILITNPNQDEGFVKESSHRNDKENNPFTYKERVKIFSDYFTKINIPKERYEFKPFDIVDETNWSETLDLLIPNLVNVYGEWSEEKVNKFKKNGYKVIRTDCPKEIPFSGKDIRKILKKPISTEEKKKELLKVGYVPEALEGLFKVVE